MSNSKRIHITGTRGNWSGKREGADRASFIIENKQDAIEKGKELASKDRGQLIIHKQNGRIQEERTYGKDPYPPKG
ncbi:MAG: DUF2188 domain-containing protein [Candidatus Hydrogenedentes bacterium]|nr:DUF2188 domain-containing protein [Candidatus Hydrogenedentota bacterium]